MNEAVSKYVVPVQAAPGETATEHQPVKKYPVSAKPSAVRAALTPVVNVSGAVVPVEDPDEELNVTVFVFGDHIS